MDAFTLKVVIGRLMALPLLFVFLVLGLEIDEAPLLQFMLSGP